LRSAVRLGIFVVTSLILVVAIALSFESSSAKNHLGVLPSLLTNPISLAIATGIMIFLIVERWRNIEAEIEKVRDEQSRTLKEIRDDSEELAKSKVDQVANRAQAIEGKISDLVDKHPWVEDISKMEIIPDSPLCRVVLATAEELLATRAPLLCYEYLSSILRTSSEISLEGVADDFLDLSYFCGIALQDDYLAYRAIAKGIDCATAVNELTPYYLRLAIRHSVYGTATRTAHTIMSQVNPPGITHFLVTLLTNRGGIMGYLPMFVIERSRRRDSEAEALASLAIFEAAYGRKDRAARFLQKARKRSEGTGESVVLRSAAVEVALFSGPRKDAVEGARALNVDDTLSSSALLELQAVLRKAELRDPVEKVTAILRARLKNRLHDSMRASSTGQRQLPSQATAQPGAQVPDGNGVAVNISSGRVAQASPTAQPDPAGPPNMPDRSVPPLTP
jgi:hypothetical protein